MTDIFLSYSRKDSDLAQRLYTRLVAKQRSIWMDIQSIPRGENWWSEIQTGIEGADNFLCIISENWLSSEICHQELAYARLHNKRIFPLIRQQIDSAIEGRLQQTWMTSDNESLARDNWQYICSRNWLMFDTESKFEDEFALLIEALDKDLPHIKAHTRYQLRALEWERSGKNPAFLLAGDDLRFAENWLKQSTAKTPEPTPEQQAYIPASRTAENRRRFQFLSLIAATVLFIVVALIAGSRALQATEQVNTANSTVVALQQDADTLTISNQARQVLNDGNNVLALSLAMAASSATHVPAETRAALAEIAFAPGERKMLVDDLSTFQSMAVSPDGNFVLIGGCMSTTNQSGTNKECTQGSLSLWELSTGALLQRFLGHTSAITSIAFSPDGKTALTGSNDQTLILWDLGKRVESRAECAEDCLIEKFEGHHGAISKIIFSNDGKTAISGGCGRADGKFCSVGEFIRWDISTGKLLNRFEDELSCAIGVPNACVNDIALSSDGAFAATVTVGSLIHYWDLETGDLIREFQLPPQPAAVLAVSFALDDASILTLDANGRLIQWNLADDEESILPDPCIYECILAVSSGPDRLTSAVIDVADKHILTGIADGRIELWELAFSSSGVVSTLRQRLTLAGHSDTVIKVAFTSLTTAISLAEDNRLIQWDLANASTIKVMNGHTLAVWAVEYSRNGERILSGSWDHTMILWDGHTGNLIWQLPYSDGIWSVDITSDGKIGVSGALDNSVILWDLDTQQQLKQFSAHTTSVNRVAFNIDDRWLVSTSISSAGNPARIFVWNVQTGEKREFESPSVTVWRAAFSPNSNYIIAGGDDGLVRMWDVESGKIVRTFGDKGSQVVPVVFSPDGSLIVSGSIDGTIAIWNAETGLKIDSLCCLSTKALAFSDDGKILFSSGNSADDPSSTTSRLLLWNTTTWEVVGIYRGHSIGANPIAVNPANKNMVVTGIIDNSIGGDYALTLRNIEVPVDLREWTLEHRYVRELSCAERRNYNVAPQCESVPIATATQ